MPDIADRLHVPSSPPPRHRSRLAALAIAASVAVHGVAAAAVAGFWGDEPETAAQPIEVVLVTLTRPGRSPAPAPSAAIGVPVEAAGSAGPPDASFEKAAPLEHPAAVPAPKAVADRAPLQTAPPAPRPETADSAPKPMALASLQTPAIKAATVERLEERPGERDRMAPAQSRPTLGSAAPPPRPIARPSAPADTASAEHRTGIGKAAPTAAQVTLASVPAPPKPGALGTPGSPATFVLGSAGNPSPDYPMRARRKGWEGRVVLRVAVDRYGRPSDIRVAETSGHAVLDEAAHRTVADWVFRPATRGGRPIAGEALVPVVFRLN